MCAHSAFLIPVPSICYRRACVCAFDSAKLIYRFYCYFCIISCSLCIRCSFYIVHRNHFVRCCERSMLLWLIVVHSYCISVLYFAIHYMIGCLCVSVCWLTSRFVFSTGIIDLNCGWFVWISVVFTFCVSVAFLFYDRIFSIFSQINFILGCIIMCIRKYVFILLLFWLLLLNVASFLAFVCRLQLSERVQRVRNASEQR